MLEETGLAVRVTKLIGVYSSPHHVSEYPDGNRWHGVDLLFEATLVGGALSLNEECAEARFCAQQEIDWLDLHEQDREWVLDVFSGRQDTAVR